MRIDEKRVRHLSDAEQAGWVQLPNVVLFDQVLTDKAKVLYGALLFFARAKDETWPGQETLASMLGCSPRTLQDRFRELEERTLIETRRRGQGKTNLYRIREISSLTSELVPLLTGEPLPGEERRGEERKEEEGLFGSSPSLPRDSERAQPPSDVDVEALFTNWLEHHATVTGERPPGTKTKARKQLLASFGARLAEGFTVDELKLATLGAWNDPFRREHGHFGTTSVLRPLKVNELVNKGRRHVKRETAPNDDDGATARAVRRLRAEGRHEEADALEAGE